MSGGIPAPPAEVPHLTSPENLPSGTTMDEGALPAQGPNVTYLKELWHAIQTQDVTGKDALLALTQRPLTTPAQENVNGPGPRSGCGGSAAAPGPDPDAPPPASDRLAGLGRSHPFVGAVGEELVLPHR